MRIRFCRQPTFVSSYVTSRGCRLTTGLVSMHKKAKLLNNYEQIFLRSDVLEILQAVDIIFTFMAVSSAYFMSVHSGCIAARELAISQSLVVTWKLLNSEHRLQGIRRPGFFTGRQLRPQQFSIQMASKKNGCLKATLSFQDKYTDKNKRTRKTDPFCVVFIF